MLYSSAAITIGQTYKVFKQSGDLGARLLLGVVQIVLALILFPPLLLGIIVAGIYAAGDWCALRIGAAVCAGCASVAEDPGLRPGRTRSL